MDFALRYSHYIGDWDIGAHWFHGTGREPNRTLPFSSNGQRREREKGAPAAAPVFVKDLFFNP